jgi:ComF family protein
MNAFASFGKWAEKLRKVDASRGYSCDICGKEVFRYPNERLCTDCQKELDESLVTRSCEKCGRQTVAEGICLACKRVLPAFDKGYAAFSYTERLRAVVARFKMGERHLAYELGKRLLEKIQAVLPTDTLKNALFVPVPTSEDRRRERGYNQAEELTKALVELGGFRAEYGLLVKTKDNAAQKTMDSKARAENVRGAYRVHQRALCKGSTIVLVDDVRTTGATGNECGRILKNAGADKVYLLVVAALPERL